MTFTVTPEPDHLPPRVRIDVGTDDPDKPFESLMVYRDGHLLREQPVPGGPQAVAFDYEAPFGVPVTYTVEGGMLLPSEPDWTENWADLADWEGQTEAFTVADGKASSILTGAAITRAAAGTIERVEVTDPSYVRLELLGVSGAVVASVQVGVNTVASGMSAATVPGSGSFSLILTNGTMLVVGPGASAAVTYDGDPVTVRVVGLGVSYPEAPSIPIPAIAAGIATDSAGNVYVSDVAEGRVRKLSPAGTLLMSITTPQPSKVFVGVADKIYVTSVGDRGFRRFAADGSPELTRSLGYTPQGITADSSGRIFVTDGQHSILEYGPGGGAAGEFAAAPVVRDLGVDAAGNVYVVSNGAQIRKFNPSGTLTQTFAVAGAQSIDVAADGTMYVACGDGTVRRIDPAGFAEATIATGQIAGVATDSDGDVYVANATAATVKKFIATTPSVGSITETPTSSPEPFFGSLTDSLDVTEAWLIHPTFNTLSCSIDAGQHNFRDVGINVARATKSALTRASKAARHDPQDAEFAVVFTSGARSPGEWEMLLHARTLPDRDTVTALCRDQSPLLLRSPAGWVWDLPDGWYSVGDLGETRPREGLHHADRQISLPLTPVPEPTARLAASWTFAQDLMRNPTFADSLAEFPTFLERLVGP